MSRKAYTSDGTDNEWAFVAPYLTLMTEAAPQREHSLREVFNGLRWLVRAGASWRMMPNDLPPWHTVYQQTQRWLQANVFENIVHGPGNFNVPLDRPARAQPSSIKRAYPNDSPNRSDRPLK
jgi:hypothetical protein